MFYELVHPEDLKIVENKLKEIYINQSAKMEYRCRHAKGHYLWMETHGKIIENEQGKVIGAVLSSRDVSDRKIAENKEKKILKKFQAAVEGTVQAMGRIVEKRDQYTAGHQERVAKLACAIAEELGMEQERIEGLRLSAKIHDIGKIAIPAEILTKPGKLEQTEFEIIKDHPQTGFEILKDIEFPWPVADVVAQHHEKVDGSGYNRGLKKEEILPEARILCVADVVEAMTSHRPYRPALGVEKAMEEISDKKGVYYDAEVVDACIKLFVTTQAK